MSSRATPPPETTESASQNYQGDGEHCCTDHDTDGPDQKEHGEHYAHAEEEEPRDLAIHTDLQFLAPGADAHESRGAAALGSACVSIAAA